MGLRESHRRPKAGCRSRLGQVFSMGSVALLFSLFLLAAAEAGTLEGSVTGAGNAPKRFVRIEISGPTSKTVFSNEAGQFSADLVGGQYLLRIIEKNRVQDFSVVMPDTGDLQQTFQLGW